MGAHARLTCSGAYRWMACPGSVNLEAQFPRTESVYAMEGTTAHALLEIALLLGLPAEDCLDLVEGATPEMAESLQPTVDWLNRERAQRPGAQLRLEARVRPGARLGRDDLWGTADVLILDPERREIVLTDLKFGVKPVHVEGNAQLQLYALGALGLVDWPVERVVTVVAQPRGWHKAGPIRQAIVSTEALDAFAQGVKAAAERTEDPTAPLVAGKHCDFCNAAGGCPALADLAIRLAQEEFEEMVAKPLTAVDVAELLAQVDAVKTWVRALESHALSLALTGEHLPGWKLAKRRAHRSWINPEEARKTLAETYGLDEDQIAPRELASPAQIEKAVKATKQKPNLSSLVAAPDIGWRLAPDFAPDRDDILSAEEEFAGIAWED